MQAEKSRHSSKVRYRRVKAKLRARSIQKLRSALSLRSAPACESYARQAVPGTTAGSAAACTFAHPSTPTATILLELCRRFTSTTRTMPLIGEMISEVLRWTMSFKRKEPGISDGQANASHSCYSQSVRLSTTCYCAETSALCENG